MSNFEMFDNFLYKNRFVIGGVLIVIILAGLSVIGYDKYYQSAKTKENQEIAELKTQNELLRQQLSENTQQIAGATTESLQNVALSTNQGTKININTADAAELDKIPGVGPARAADIIAYRQSRGGFKTIEEIKNVKGIGEKTFESMKDLITVGN